LGGSPKGRDPTGESPVVPIARFRLGLRITFVAADESQEEQI